MSTFSVVRSQLLDELLVRYRVVVERRRQIQVFNVAQRHHTDTRQQHRALDFFVFHLVCLEVEVELGLVQVPVVLLWVILIDGAEDAMSYPTAVEREDCLERQYENDEYPRLVASCRSLRGLRVIPRVTFNNTSDANKRKRA